MDCYLMMQNNPFDIILTHSVNVKCMLLIKHFIVTPFLPYFMVIDVYVLFNYNQVTTLGIENAC